MINDGDLDIAESELATNTDFFTQGNVTPMDYSVQTSVTRVKIFVHEF